MQSAAALTQADMAGLNDYDDIDDGYYYATNDGPGVDDGPLGDSAAAAAATAEPVPKEMMHRVTFNFSAHQSPKDLMAAGGDASKITLSAENGGILGTVLFSHADDASEKNRSRLAMVSHITLDSFRTNYDRNMILSFPTIPALKNELVGAPLREGTVTAELPYGSVNTIIPSPSSVASLNRTLGASSAVDTTSSGASKLMLLDRQVTQAHVNVAARYAGLTVNKLKESFKVDPHMPENVHLRAGTPLCDVYNQLAADNNLPVVVSGADARLAIADPERYVATDGGDWAYIKGAADFVAEKAYPAALDHINEYYGFTTPLEVKKMAIELMPTLRNAFNPEKRMYETKLASFGDLPNMPANLNSAAEQRFRDDALSKPYVFEGSFTVHYILV